MSWEYLHLITHPFAIVLSIAGAAVGLAGWVTGRESLERYGLISLLLAAVSAVPSYATGIAAGDIVSERTFVQPSDVQTHRTWATWAALALVTCGIFAGFAMSQPGDRRLRRFALLVGAAAAALTGFAAFRGGKIVHGEDLPGGVEPVREASHRAAVGQVSGAIDVARLDGPGTAASRNVTFKPDSTGTGRVNCQGPVV